MIDEASSHHGRYDSTLDILYNLYDLVSVGGTIIVDDFLYKEIKYEGSGVNGSKESKLGAKQAVLDFRELHGIEDDAHHIHSIDNSAVWFRKARQVRMKRHAYLRSLETGVQDALKPERPIDEAAYIRLKTRYDYATDRKEVAALHALFGPGYAHFPYQRRGHGV